MEGKQLAVLRKKYKEMIKNRNRLKKIMDRMEKLEQIPEVKEYKELFEQYSEYDSAFALENDFKNKSDYEIALDVASSNLVTPTTNTYIYFSTYVFSHKYGKEIYISKPGAKDEILQYVFVNAESLTYLPMYADVRPDELEEFTKNNIVIYPTNKCNSKEFSLAARHEFIATEITKGEEEAIKQYKKYAKNGYPWGKRVANK